MLGLTIVTTPYVGSSVYGLTRGGGHDLDPRIIEYRK